MDEDGVQLGGKRAAILYAHRLREAAPAAVVDEGEEAAKADEGKVSTMLPACKVHSCKVFLDVRSIFCGFKSNPAILCYKPDVRSAR